MKNFVLGVSAALLMLVTVQANAQKSFLSAGFDISHGMTNWAMSYTLPAGISVEY